MSMITKWKLIYCMPEVTANLAISTPLPERPMVRIPIIPRVRSSASGGKAFCRTPFALEFKALLLCWQMATFPTLCALEVANHLPICESVSAQDEKTVVSKKDEVDIYISAFINCLKEAKSDKLFFLSIKVAEGSHR